jgi:Protein of unknown function (DUF2934)
MKRKNLSPIEKSASTRPPTPAALPKQTAIDFRQSRDEVARRAYSIYRDQGSPQGHDMQHWLEAEAQVIAARKAGRESALM